MGQDRALQLDRLRHGIQTENVQQSLTTTLIGSQCRRAVASDVVSGDQQAGGWFGTGFVRHRR